MDIDSDQAVSRSIVLVRNTTYYGITNMVFIWNIVCVT